MSLRDDLIYELDQYREAHDISVLSDNDCNAFTCRLASLDFVQDALTECCELEDYQLWQFEKDFKNYTREDYTNYATRVVFNCFMSLFFSRIEHDPSAKGHAWFKEHEFNWSAPYKELSTVLSTVFGSEN